MSTDDESPNMHVILQKIHDNMALIALSISMMVVNRASSDYIHYWL